MRAPEEVEIGLRTWAVPDYARHRPKGSGREYVDLGPSGTGLILDSESSLGPGQRLRVGAAQVRRPGRRPKEYLFFDPEAITAKERATIETYARERGLTVMTREVFVEKVFFRVAFWQRGMVIGHNLPFDLFRMAIEHEPTKSRNRSMRGGFTLGLIDNERRPRVQIKRAHPGAAFLRLTIPSGRHSEQRNRDRGGTVVNHHGYFLDTATIGGALLGGRPSLEKLARDLETAHQKTEAEHGAEITPTYLDYLRNDVQVTFECAEALRERYAAYGLDKPIYEIYSDASIGKAHLDQMGIRSWDRSDFDPWLTSAVLESYYGGRTECMLRRVAVPGAYLDFSSQYPTSFVLQGLWRYVIAERIEWEEEDLSTVRAFLERIDVDAVLDPALWRKLDMLLLVAPEGDRLPTRARYPRRPRRPGIVEAPRTFNVAVPYRTGGEAQWWTLADCIASILHTGRVPTILRAIRFRAVGVQEGLKPVDIAGNPDFRVDPYSDDFIKRLVELRAQVKGEMKSAKRAGDRDRENLLDAIQQGMKITANSICYGTGIEMNVVEHRKPVGATIYLPDGTSYRAKLKRSEQPGSRFNPLIATLVTGGGRLMLAAAMHLIDRAGGVYATCDTDSVFPVATKKGGLIPCPGGPHRTAEGEEAIKALSWEHVREIVDRFESLNPFDPGLVPGSILEFEGENFGPDTGEQWELECFAIASKRYTLFVRDRDGRPKIVGGSEKRKRSEHGLGHLMPPNAQSPELDDQEWEDRWWEHLLCRELGLDDPEPDYFSAPAVGRLTVTSPREEASFRDYNAGKPYPEKVRPWNFLCLAHPTQLERARPGGAKVLIAPFERDPEKRLAADWVDRGNPGVGPIKVRVDPTREVVEGSVAVLSYGDYFEDYRLHPEAKTLAPDGRPCHPWTRGLLLPRCVAPSGVVRIGKESNRLSETPMPAELDEEAVVEYPGPRTCRGCGAEVGGRRKWCSERCRKRTARTARRRTTN